MASEAPPVVLRGLKKSFEGSPALRGIEAEIRAGRLTGLVGPDGAGKTTLIRLLAGLLTPDSGELRVFCKEPVKAATELAADLGYMPQRFGLYEDLSVLQNLRLYARLRGLDASAERFEELLDFTGLEPFIARLAGDLSGGMKQKLGLACALMAKPRLLLLDEPSVGVDPLSRRELWRMVEGLAEQGVAVLWSTAYLDEAERCQDVLLLREGELLFAGPPQDLLERVEGRCFRLSVEQDQRRELLAEALELEAVRDGVIHGDALRLVLAEDAGQNALAEFAKAHQARCEAVEPRFEEAFVDLLGGGPGGRSALAERMPAFEFDSETAVSCRGLSRRFGDFTAAEDISFEVRRGEIFGLLGPNGAGKSTTFRMLCGLLKPSAGQARVAGRDPAEAGREARARIGYMAQKFSLYGLLSVGQNLRYAAGLYGLSGGAKRARIEEVVEAFELAPLLDRAPGALPLGHRQRLALACALLHRPQVLFLDEPTSGVDPISRREFWTHINGLARRGVSVLVTTHFMEEAEYCDRVAMILRGRLIALDRPDALKASVREGDEPLPTMEQAFIRLAERGERSPEQAA
jgi:ABC-2 type transport system ATP-binding protein